MTFTHNVVSQAADADNPAIINYDLTRGGEALSLTITDNEITNFHPRGRLLRNATSLSPTVSNNKIINKRRGFMRIKQTPAQELRQQIRIETNSQKAALLPPVPEAPAHQNGKRSGILKAPTFEGDENALARFKLRNNWNEGSEADLFTFGQVFREGALFPDEKIAAAFDGAEFAAQLDVHARHEDGSVRHGAITIKTPPLSSGKTIEGALVKTGSTALSDFDASEILTSRFDFPLSLLFHYGDGSTRKVRWNARASAIDAFGRSEELWLNGPLVKEARFEHDVAPHLRLRFDVRVYRDGDIRTNLVFSNEKTFSPGRRESLYDLKIGDINAPTFIADQIYHHRAATWRKVLWTGDQPKLHIIHDLGLLSDSGAILPLDPSLGVSASVAAGAEFRMKDQGPLGEGTIHKYFPSTGGRADIGMFPRWTSHYLVAQTERTKRVMLRNADAGGAAPWHHLDERTNAPLSIEDHPQFWSDERGLKPEHADDAGHPDLYASFDGRWTPDHSHKPSLFLVPWLVTADRYYADELAMQSAYAVFGRWPDLREGTLKSFDVEQVRATAWSMRDLSDAAWALPDTHPSKAYLTRALNESFRLMKEKYVDRRAMQSAGALEGYLEEDVYGEPERISPWQNDYVALALWQSARRGDPHADDLLSWSSNFHLERVLSDAIPPKYAAAYMFPAKGEDGRSPVQTWAALMARIHNVRGDYGVGMEGYPELAAGYFGSALAALGSIASTTKGAAAYDALSQLVRYTDDFLFWKSTKQGSVTTDNNFLFKLILPSGAEITRDHIRKAKKGGANSDFLYGGKGKDTIEGNGNDDALFGFQGDDTLRGGPGADVIVAGDDDDVIHGGPGNDLLSGGHGKDTFVYGSEDWGCDQISDFDPSEDRISISDKIQSASSIPPYLVRPHAKGAMISLHEDNICIVIMSIEPKMLSDFNFTVLKTQ